MVLPFFFQPVIEKGELFLDEDTSKHLVQVLRMQKGAQLQLTNGAGIIANATITDNHKKRCRVEVAHLVNLPPSTPKKAIAISLLKNTSRFEWFVEKAAELGISEVIPLLCDRTEKHHFRADRMNGIIISAMLQSQQSWKMKMPLPVDFKSYVNTCTFKNKLIAHCMVDADKQLLSSVDCEGDTIIFIGPEGDFTAAEIALSRALPVSLGETRLRTETAGLTAAVLLTQ